MVEEHLGGDIGAVLAVGAVVDEPAVEEYVVGGPAEGRVQLIFEAMRERGEQGSPLLVFAHVGFPFNVIRREFGGIEGGVQLLRAPEGEQYAEEENDLDGQRAGDDDEMLFFGMDHGDS